MARTEDEALYGGAAGGGKSDALVIEALRQVDIPHYRGLILRKTFPQLRELIDKTMQYYKPCFPKARYPHYLSAQMDLALGETDRYANEMQVANNCQEEFAIWCRQHYLPKMDTKWRY